MKILQKYLFRSDESNYFTVIVFYNFTGYSGFIMESLKKMNVKVKGIEKILRKIVCVWTNNLYTFFAIGNLKKDNPTFTKLIAENFNIFCNVIYVLKRMGAIY